MANINKQEVITAYARQEGDTGSPEVQIALLTAKIRNLTEHLKNNKHDFHSLRGLKKMVGRRDGLLRYLKKTNLDKYRELKAQLEIR